MEYIVYTSGNELAHHGIRGMKWGIRRYQNKDGSLTAAGKKRRATTEEEKLKERERSIAVREKERARRDKLAAKKAELDAREKALRSKNGPLSKKEAAKRNDTRRELTNDELRDRINRMRLEKEYYDAAKNLAEARPAQISKGQRFMKSLVDDVVIPAAKKSGQAYLEKFMKDKLGLNEKDPMASLEKQAKKLKVTKEIEEYKRDIEKIKRGKSDSDYSLDGLLEAYRNIPAETRQELSDAAKIQENLNKLKKKN